MTRNYAAGLRAVLACIVAFAMISGVVDRLRPYQAPPAAEDLGPSAHALGDFRLEERSGRAVTAGDLADRVAIASFIFTRCPLSCPRITGIMQGLQGRLAGSDATLVSISVDPEHDTPAVLRQYAERYGASPDRWWFLTGPKGTIYDLIRDRFLLAVTEAEGPAGPDTEAIVHSDRLALIDHGRVAGVYSSADPRALDRLVARARWLALPAWIRGLPTLNAALNGLSACLLVAGWMLIRRYRAIGSVSPPEAADDRPGPFGHPLVRGHILCMVSAIATSSLFLACYLYYHHRAGSMPFSQGGPARLIYFTILLSHTVLATVSVPLILVTVRRAWAGRLTPHVAIASFTLPIWLYVAVTGVVIYLMLYHLPAMRFVTSTGL